MTTRYNLSYTYFIQRLQLVKVKQYDGLFRSEVNRILNDLSRAKKKEVRFLHITPALK